MQWPPNFWILTSDLQGNTKKEENMSGNSRFSKLYCTPLPLSWEWWSPGVTRWNLGRFFLTWKDTFNLWFVWIFFFFLDNQNATKLMRWLTKVTDNMIQLPLSLPDGMTSLDHLKILWCTQSRDYHFARGKLQSREVKWGPEGTRHR